MSAKLSTLPSLLTGFQGGRKTAFAVANIIVPHLLAGRDVITNIPINQEILEANIGGAAMPPRKKPRGWLLRIFAPREYAKLSRRGYFIKTRWRGNMPNPKGIGKLESIDNEDLIKQIPKPSADGKITEAQAAKWKNKVIVIDEAGIMFGGLHSSDEKTKTMAKFLAVARHINALVYLIAQTPEQLPPSLSGICAWHYHATNLDFRFGMKANTSRMVVYGGVCPSRQLKSIKLNPPLSNFYFRPPQWIYKCYDSVEPYIASGADNRISKMTGSAFWVAFIVIFLLGVVPYGMYQTVTFGDDFTDGLHNNENKQVLSAPLQQRKKKPRPDFIFCRDDKCIVKGAWE